ncbi:hypothetical protein [Arthrobacter sp. MYb222]|uniref:hypothetical protein n=1 Tax=Arthrobacter sp. MYb222 TaxID=1848599 RepID=UPI0015E2993C|nr:hypothetical protein [Arthrobacter sp. MYb222]
MIEGVYMQGDTASNVFGQVFRVTDDTTDQGLVYGNNVAHEAIESFHTMSSTLASH